MSKDYLEELERLTEYFEPVEDENNANPSKAMKCAEKIEGFMKYHELYDTYKNELTTIKQSLLKAQEMKKENSRYKQLEEQLGCPLEVVITPYFKRGKLEVFYRGKMREVIRVVAFEEATRPYMDVFYRDNEKEQFKVRTIWLDDYKKTWWLRKDKCE